jgi:glucosyl-3-phosphoglycerate phosphatase
MTELIFVRHGSTPNLELQQWQGWSPVPLSGLGREQAASAARLLAGEVPIAQIFSSPIERARETAAYIAAATSLDVKPLDALKERMAPTRLWGVSHSDSHEYVTGARKHRFDPDWRYEDEESWQELSARALDFVQTMNDLVTLSEYEGTRFVLVTHGVTLRLIAATLLIGADAPLTDRLRLFEGLSAVDCCSLTRFEVAVGEARLLAWNQTQHLDAIAATKELTW